jgi:SAM-dependent methyltransferase
LSGLHGTEDYYNHPYFESRRDITPQIWNVFEARLRRIEARIGSLSGKVLVDVGCDVGHFVDHAKSTRSVTAIGADISERAVESGRACGRDLRLGSLAEVALPPGSVDVVCGFDVIEHVDDPGALVREAARVLRPQGLLVIETPNYQGLIYRIGRLLASVRALEGPLASVQERLWPPFHVQYFRSASLRDFLQRAGFRAVDTELREFASSELAVQNPLLWAGVQSVFLASRLVGAQTILCAFARREAA